MNLLYMMAHWFLNSVNRRANPLKTCTFRFLTTQVLSEFCLNSSNWQAPNWIIHKQFLHNSPMGSLVNSARMSVLNCSESLPR